MRGVQGLSPAEKKFGNFVEKQGCGDIIAKGAKHKGGEPDLWVLIK